MLSNTLSIIEMVLKNEVKCKNKIPKIMEFFNHYKKGDWVYPGVLKRHFSLELMSVYSILQELEKQGVLKSYYELYCSQCHKSMGIVEVFNKLPDTFMCEICGDELPALQNTILIYKVICDE